MIPSPKFLPRADPRPAPVPPTLAPRPLTPTRKPRGLTTAETMVSFFIIVLLASLTTVAVSRAQRSREATMCAANLRAIGLAFQYYSLDNAGTLPDPAQNALQWEDLLRKYVNRSQFRCPADQELFNALGSSYDWRDTGNPSTTLAGKQYSQALRTQSALSFEALPGWHEPGKIQVLFLDSSVQSVNQAHLLKDLLTPIGTTP